MGECTNALNLNPNYHRALVRRAKASEQLGLYKKALQDIQKANKTDTANPDTQASRQVVCIEAQLLLRAAAMAGCPARASNRFLHLPCHHLHVPAGPGPHPAEALH